jgi:hypothetical protein
MEGGGRKPGKASKAPALAMLAVFGVLALVAYAVPHRAVRVSDTNDARLARGPASYVHHVYDPDGLLGPLGNVDLGLDNFERATTHGILIAAMRSSGGDPDLTMRIAERRRPGSAGADNGAILLVFTDERRIPEGAKLAAGAVVDMVLKCGRLLILIFVVAIGGSYYFFGAGQFGGGGVDVLW